MNSGPVFFTDRDLGKKFPEILRAGGLTVERHADHFQHDTPDEVWLREIGRKGWIAVTHDAAYATNRTNRRPSWKTAWRCSWSLAVRPILTSRARSLRRPVGF